MRAVDSPWLGARVMPKIKMLNSWSLDEFRESMQGLIDEYYEMKNASRTFRRLCIKGDLDRLVAAAKAAGIEVERAKEEL